MNERHGLTEHRAYLQPRPDGGYAVLVIHEGPGGDDFLARVMESDQEFDKWFVASVAELLPPDAGSVPEPTAAPRRAPALTPWPTPSGTPRPTPVVTPPPRVLAPIAPPGVRPMWQTTMSAPASVMATAFSAEKT